MQRFLATQLGIMAAVGNFLKASPLVTGGLGRFPPAIRAWAQRHQHQLTYTKGSVQRSKRLHLVNGTKPKDDTERVPLPWKIVRSMV
jgi:hypothetical protein